MFSSSVFVSCVFQIYSIVESGKSVYLYKSVSVDVSGNARGGFPKTEEINILAKNERKG